MLREPLQGDGNADGEAEFDADGMPVASYREPAAAEEPPRAQQHARPQRRTVRTPVSPAREPPSNGSSASSGALQAENERLRERLKSVEAVRAGFQAGGAVHDLLLLLLLLL